MTKNERKVEGNKRGKKICEEIRKKEDIKNKSKQRNERET
jgi:hypothetical protein